MHCGLVARADVPLFWGHVRLKIHRAITKVGISDFNQIERDVLSGRHDLWIAYDLEKVHAAATTEIADGICTIVGCGGKGLKQFLPLIKVIEFQAKMAGCKAMRIVGRKGWSRVLPDYKPKAIIIERVL